MIIKKKICFYGITIAFFLSFTSNWVLATTSLYTFTTGPIYGNNSDLLALMSSSAFVSGTFNYDYQATSTLIAPAGHTVYFHSFTNLTGTIDGNVFSDPDGITTVGDEKYDFPGNPDGFYDFLQLNANGPLTPDDISGFTIGDYTLVNVRFFWIETMLGITDFLNNNDLLTTLPSFEGRLALDFVRTNNPEGEIFSVFFDGLLVQRKEVSLSTTKVPVYNGLWLIPAVLTGLYLLFRRREQL